MKRRPMSEETKKKISATLKALKLPTPFLKGIIPWNTGKHLPKYMRNKISQSLKNRKFSESHKKNLRLALRGNNKWSKNGNWKNGKLITNGYIYVLNRNHPFANVIGYVAEHRLVMEKKIGRFLTKTEVIHHQDRNKKNNNIENLVLFPTDKEHRRYHLLNYKD